MKPPRPPLTLLALTAVSALVLVPRATAKDLSPEDLYDKVVKSCVYIITPLKVAYAEASGSLIDVDQKLVLTNYHVVENQEFVHVQFPVYIKGQMLTDKNKYKDRIPDGLAIKAKVIYRDKSRDLALVRLDRVPPGTPAIPLAKNSPKEGESVWQIGNAGAVEQAFRVSKGEVSAVAVEKFPIRMGGELVHMQARMITATNPINPGDSGGPLFDARGYQVGVTESHDRTANLVSLFVDISEVRAFLSDKKIAISGEADEPAPRSTTKNDAKHGTPAKKGATAPSPGGDEKLAADKLRSAKLFASGDEYRSVYIEKLQEIVKKWPTTEAGKEAKKLLSALK